MVVAAPTARWDDLTGINRIEIGGWYGEIEAIGWDGPDLPGLVMTAPMRSAMDLWSAVVYKPGALLLAPNIEAIPYMEFHRQSAVIEPMRLYMPSVYKHVLVVNLQDLQ